MTNGVGRAVAGQAIVSGGRERFRPIMMTATTTMLGLIPLAVGNGHVGDLSSIRSRWR